MPTAAGATAGDRRLGGTWVSILLGQAVGLRQFLGAPSPQMIVLPASDGCRVDESNRRKESDFNVTGPGQRGCSAHLCPSSGQETRMMVKVVVLVYKNSDDDDDDDSRS